MALYVTDVAGRGPKAATVQRRLAAITRLHQEAGLDDPTKTKAVGNTWRGIAREIGTYQKRKTPILTPAGRVLDIFSSERGLAGGYRFLKPASPLLEDVEYAGEGAVILLRHSETAPCSRTHPP